MQICDLATTTARLAVKAILGLIYRSMTALYGPPKSFMLFTSFSPQMILTASNEKLDGAWE